MTAVAANTERQRRQDARLARQTAPLTQEEVLRCNFVERIKHEKLPYELEQELPRLAQTPYEAVSEEDILRLQWLGLYHDRPKVGGFMMRIKIPNGILTPLQLRAVGELVVRHGHDQAEITTRQDIQIHGIRLDVVPEVFDQLSQAGLSAKGGCGDVVRNITGCPVAGVDPDELFDTAPLVLEAHCRLAANPACGDLPRKHKWSISACPCHCNAPEIHDAALVGTVQDGHPGFAVWIGGGLSATPRLAKPLGVFATPSEALTILEALLEVWRTDLNYRLSRSKARFKFMVDDYGPEQIRERVEQHLGRRLTDLKENPVPIGRTDHMGIHGQKQLGFNYLGFPVLAGLIRGGQLLKIAEIVEGMGDDVRLTRQQNLIVTGVSDCGVASVVELMEQEAGLALRVNPLRARSISCTGHPCCNFSVGETKRKLVEVVEHLESEFADAVAGLCLHLDGCPHACGQHWVGDIGIQGATLTTPTGKIQAYDILLRGGLGSQVQIGKALLRRVPTDELKFHVERLVRAYLAERQNGEPIQGFFARHSDEALVAVARGNSAVVAPAAG